MQKNVLLAIVLSVLVLVLYQFFILSGPPSPEEERRISPPVEEEEKGLPREEAQELVLENNQLKLTFTSRGGKIKSWYVKDSKKELMREGAFSLNLDLWLPSGEKIELNESILQFQREERKVSFVWKDEEKGFKIVKNLEIPEQGYDALATIKTEGLPPGSKYFLSWPGGIGKKAEGERLVFFKDALLEEKKGGLARHYGPGIKWMGIRQGKKLLVLMASLNQPLEGEFGLNAWDPWGFRDNKYESRWIIYGGPQNYAELKMINDRIENSTGEDYCLSKAIKLSFWSYLSIGLIKILLFFFSFTHNYGVAIILLTLLIYGILSPLTFKQFKSMQQMQVVQPEIATIQKKFKGDPKRLQTEIMKIYRKHKVNPMAGCLPLFIQLPIIFILYRALLNFNFSENPSFLWIKNLGEPDIPLLLVLGGTMFLQQRISRKTQSPGSQQGMAKMMQFFPIFIIIFLWSLPSGVMLYWFTSTLISLAQQFFISRKTVIVVPKGEKKER